ncbi:hypothetical protein [Edaphovirga cremea]|jgi:hypothetical protein|uniref:hypothetical protein n=1 Tax=Edaphovirga cremea TaxID=2267246 RepID=UPI000DEF7B70|nr:hypothetical protein [Edaphovirga cremea]
MCNNLTRLELIDAANNSQFYIKQLRGVICALSDNNNQKDNEESWQIAAILTLACLAYKELEPAAQSTINEPGVEHVA